MTQDPAGSAILASALRARTEHFVHAVSHETREGSGPAMPPEGIAQMVRGFFHLLDANLVGDDREVRSMYFDNVMPGLRDAGVPLVMMVPGTARVLTMLAADVVAQLPEEHRAFAIRWLGDFVERYIGDIIRVWEQRT